MVHRLPLTRARVNLGRLIRRVHVHKEYFILEKDGIPVAGVMDAEEFEDYLEARDPEVSSHIRESQEEYLAGKFRPAESLLRKPKKRSRARRHRRQ
ncbi:MAG: type II toxin-antitoxin system Phd/YefM family antitoxin [Candidatus Acidiferrales bacterium]